MRANSRTPGQHARCETCLGMGYKGRMRRGNWKIETCRSCGGTGTNCPYCGQSGPCRASARSANGADVARFERIHREA